MAEDSPKKWLSNSRFLLPINGTHPVVVEPVMAHSVVDGSRLVVEAVRKKKSAFSRTFGTYFKIYYFCSVKVISVLCLLIIQNNRSV